MQQTMPMQAASGSERTGTLQRPDQQVDATPTYTRSLGCHRGLSFQPTLDRLSVADGWCCRMTGQSPWESHRETAAMPELAFDSHISTQQPTELPHD